LNPLPPAAAAVVLATSTPVRLLPEKLVLHNRRYLVLCVDGPSARSPDCLWAARSCRFTLGYICFRRVVCGYGAVRTMDGESIASLMHQNFISLALLIATTLVAGFFAYIYSIKRQTYLLLWTAGWTVFGLHYLGQALAEEAPPGAYSHAARSSLNN